MIDARQLQDEMSLRNYLPLEAKTHWKSSRVLQQTHHAVNLLWVRFKAISPVDLEQTKRAQTLRHTPTRPSSTASVLSISVGQTRTQPMRVRNVRRLFHVPMLAATFHC